MIKLTESLAHDILCSIMDNHQNVINSLNISSMSTQTVSKVEHDLQNWSIPKEPFKRIYQIGNFRLANA